MATPESAQPRVRARVRQPQQLKAGGLRGLAAYIGAVTAVAAAIGFAAAYFSWSYARGFLIGLNLPTALLSYSKAFQAFPEVGIRSVGWDVLSVTIAVLIAYALLGSAAPSRRVNRKDGLYVLLAIVAILAALIIMEIAQTQTISVWYQRLLTYVTLLLPFAVIVVAFRGPGMLLAGAVALLAIFTQAQYTVVEGRFEAQDLSRPKPSQLPTGFFSSRELPLVDIVSDTPLDFQTVPVVSDPPSHFHYNAAKGSLIRLVYGDSGSNYYFLESTPSGHTVISVQASDILELRYLAAPP